MLDTISMAEKLRGDYRKVFEKADMYCVISSENEQQLHIIDKCERLGITITQYTNDDTV